MTPQEVGSIAIIAVGLLILGASVPVPRLIARHYALAAQVSPPLIRWLTRIFGTLTCILGLVTMFHR